MQKITQHAASQAEVGSLCDEALDPPELIFTNGLLQQSWCGVCGLGWADAYKSPVGKGFLMQHSALAASIFCHSAVKDERPGGNIAAPEMLRAEL